MQATVQSTMPISGLDLGALRAKPGTAVRGGQGGSRFQARIAMPDYGRRIAAHFGLHDLRGLRGVCDEAEVPFAFSHFGLICEFDEPVKLRLHDGGMVLDETIRALVKEFGPVVLRNAYLGTDARQQGHRNIFPHLRFHYDRPPGQPNHYTMFCRDPFDPDHAAPRLSSTLFIANIVARLQDLKEHPTGNAVSKGVRPNYDIFMDRPIAEVLNDIVFEQAWAAPEGTGEICIIDNYTVLHASCHHDAQQHGYRIDARYLF